MTFTAVVLAADRGEADPLVRAAGVRSKALVPVGGRPMVLRVVEALEASREVSGCVLVGPVRSVVETEPAIAALFDSGRATWVEPGRTPSESAVRALAGLPPEAPVLLTTADHALLTAGIVDAFCRDARASGRDLVAGAASYPAVAARYPGVRRTVIRLADGEFCGCNLFGILTPAGRKAPEFWRRVEASRKRPARWIGAIGWTLLFRYATGRLTLADGLERISRKMDLRAGVVVLPFPEAAVDVDSVSDWDLVRAVVGDPAR